MDGESVKAQDARVETLWATLGPKEGCLDLAGLKKGLRKIDHPLKNATALLEDVMKAVDTNSDGQIQFSEFQTFVKHAEKQLWSMFQSIDRDHNGKLDKDELRSAFRQAGLAVPNSKFDRFFAEVDTNHDGEISFDEWRNFLLFIPANTPNLRAVLSYYTSTTRVNPEGDVDVHISDEAKQELGTKLHFLLILFFGAIVNIAKSPRRTMAYPFETHAFVLEDQQSQALPQFLPPHLDPAKLPSASLPASWWIDWEDLKPALIECVPKPGYFLAGGLAGIVSRTTTAPLDRLKVYLIAQTGVAHQTVQAAKSGAVIQAAKNAWRPLADACKDLWRAGGMRSLFAGNGLNVVKVMPESAVKFGAFEASKRVLANIEGHGDPKHVHPWSSFLAGGLGGMVSQFVVYPIDTLKFRMQCETVKGGLHGNQLIAATARKMWRVNGIRAFYRGLPMGLAGMFPYAAIDLGTFELLKHTLTGRNARIKGCHEEDAAPGSIMTAAIGGFSGALGASVVYPLNLLRTRLQSQGTVLHPRTYTGIIDVTRQTIQGEGFRGLFKGITPNLLKVVPAVSITYVVYENSKRALDLS